MGLVHLFWIFFRIGLFGFGGGYAILPMIYQGALEFGIMSADEFSQLVAISQVTPGPVAINAATYVGFQYAGFAGALVATVGVILPSVILVFVVTRFLVKFKESRTLDSVLGGIRPATIGLLLSAVVFLSEESIFNAGVFTLRFFDNPAAYFNPVPIIFCLVTGLVYWKFRISPIKLTIMAGVLGAILIR